MMRGSAQLIDMVFTEGLAATSIYHYSVETMRTGVAGYTLSTMSREVHEISITRGAIPLSNSALPPAYQHISNPT